MFDRAIQSAFICLRCQSRLLRQQTASSSSVRIRRPKTAARWQSTVVARVEEEDDDNDGHKLEDEEAETRPNRSDIPRPMSGLTSQWKKPSLDQHRGAYRKFHPDHVAELGLSSLGKPAEVLVLQPRDRRIPRAPIEDNQDNEPHLLESLQAETAPLDPEQVKQNIEQVKKHFGGGGQTLNEAQWKELRHNLVKGFTHVQLLDYIRHMEERMQNASKERGEPADTSSLAPLSSELSRVITEERESKRSGRNKIKRRAAISIMKDIWSFSLPVGEEEAEDMQKVTVSMSRHHIGALKAQASQPFKKMAESLKVKIDIFQDKGKLGIYGSTATIEEARKALISMKSQITSMTIDSGKAKHLLPILRDGKYEQSLLMEVRRNRPVYVEKRTLSKGFPQLRISYHKSEREEAEAARRDILLAGRRLGPKSSVSSWPPRKEKSTWLVPYTPWHALPWWERLGNWGRWGVLQEADGKAAKELPAQATLTSALPKQVYTLMSSSSPRFDSSKKKGRVFQTYEALFGQALFRRDIKYPLPTVLGGQIKEPSNIQHPDLKLPGTAPSMVTDIPLLAHSLAACKPWPANSKGSVDGREQSTPKRPFLHRLHFLPVVAESGSPPLQVHLQGDDLQLGLQQPLRIHSITAVLEERSHFLLLPDFACDINFRKQVLYYFYRAGLNQKNPKHTQFNEQLLRYLNQAQGQEVPRFAPFVTLNLPIDFVERFTKKLSSPLPSALKRGKPPPDSSDNASLGTTGLAEPTPKPGPTEYILAASETVEVASFSPTVANGLCLDHIHFSAPDGTQSRQELRLAERPFPDRQASTIPFPELFDGAYGLASWLGDPKLPERQA
jgi:hypothetical protein